MGELCVYYSTCPILTGKVEIDENRLKQYKGKFCEGGKNSYTACVRFKVREIVGRCPLDIMPDSDMSPEEIIEKYDL